MLVIDLHLKYLNGQTNPHTQFLLKVNCKKNIGFCIDLAKELSSQMQEYPKSAWTNIHAVVARGHQATTFSIVGHRDRLDQFQRFVKIYGKVMLFVYIGHLPIYSLRFVVNDVMALNVMAWMVQPCNIKSALVSLICKTYNFKQEWVDMTIRQDHERLQKNILNKIQIQLKLKQRISLRNLKIWINKAPYTSSPKTKAQLYKTYTQCLQCPISHQLMSFPVQIRQCGHLFDYFCIRPWLQNKGKCPICRVGCRVTSLAVHWPSVRSITGLLILFVPE